MKNAFTDEMLAKCHKLIRLMEQRNLNGILLETVHNQTWLVPTIEPYTPLVAESSKLLLHLSRLGDITVAGPENELPQILERDFSSLQVESFSYPWHRDKRREIAYDWKEKGQIGSDGLIPNTLSVTSELEVLRATLSDVEQTRYRQLGNECARTLTEVLYEATPGMTEADIAAMVAAKLLPQGVVPEVLLVGADERLERFRHPHTTLHKVQRYVMINLTARRMGLYLSLSRARYFGKLPAELAKKQQVAAQVDATLLSLSRPGVSLGELYIAAKDAYAKAGYSGEEQFHHQGGTTGYRGRERRVQPHETWQLMDHQAIAFNPTVSGAKSEDTAIIRPDRVEIISTGSVWPMSNISVNGIVLERPVILSD